MEARRTGRTPASSRGFGRQRRLSKAESNVFGIKKRNLLKSAVRQHWGKVGIAVKRKKAG